MASFYRKGNKIYISWYDPIEGRVKNKSTGLSYDKDNMKKAKHFAREFQKSLDERNERIKTLGIKKDTIGVSIQHFLKINGDKNPNTIKGYNIFFDKFNLRFSKEDNCTTITKLSCEDWLTSFRGSKYQPNTLAGISKTLKKYLSFLFEYNYVPMFMINKNVTYKPEVKDIITFSDADIKTMVKGLTEKNSNFRTTFYLLLYTGLRPSDIKNILVENIDLESQVLKYYSIKTKTYFTIPFHPDLVPILIERIAEVKNGQLLNYESAKNMGKAFKRYLEDLEIDNKSYNLRTFRKTFITTAHECGLDLATVAKLAGHFKITTTEKYYNKLSLKKKSTELIKIIFPVKDDKTEVETEVHLAENSPQIDVSGCKNSLKTR